MERETIDGWMDEADRRHKQPGWGRGLRRTVPGLWGSLGLMSAGIWRKSCSHEEGEQRGRESGGVWGVSEGLDDG